MESVKFVGLNPIGTLITYQCLSIKVMKSLSFNRNETGQKVTVKCADGEVSVYSKCAYCKHCQGVLVGKRVIPSPQKEKIADVKRGVASDEDLMNAAMMFNTLIRDGSALICDDEKDSGFVSLYQY